MLRPNYPKLKTFQDKILLVLVAFSIESGFGLGTVSLEVFWNKSAELAASATSKCRRMSACGRTQTASQGLLAFVRPMGGVGDRRSVKYRWWLWAGCRRQLHFGAVMMCTNTIFVSAISLAWTSNEALHLHFRMRMWGILRSTLRLAWLEWHLLDSRCTGNMQVSVSA